MAFEDGSWFASGQSSAAFFPDARPIVEGSWFASGTSQATWYGALGWVARCVGAFTFDPVGGPEWSGTLRRDPEILIQTQSNDSPSKSTFTDEEEPALGQNVQLDMHDGLGVILGGTVQSYVTRYEGLTNQLAFDTTIADYLWLLNKRRPFGCFTDVPADEVAQSIRASYAPSDFSGAGIVSGLPRITVVFDGSLDYCGCMSVIASRIAGQFRVDRDKVIYLFQDDPAPGPDPIDDDNEDLIRDQPLTITRDASQLRNRVFVRGASTKLLADSVIGATQLEIDGLDIFDPSGGEAIIGCDRFTYAGVDKTLIYPTPDASLQTGPLVVAQLKRDGGVTNSGPIRTVVRYSTAMVFDGKEGPRGPIANGPVDRVNPTMGSSVAFINGGGFIPAGHTVEWLFGFRDSGGALYDTNIGNTGSTSRGTIGAYLVTVNLGILADEHEPSDVVLWRRANIPGGDPGPSGTVNGWFYEVGSQPYVPGQSVYAFTDGKDDASLGNAAPWGEGLYTFNRYDTIGHKVEVLTLGARNTATNSGADQLKVYREEGYNGLVGTLWTEPQECMTFDTSENVDATTPQYTEDLKPTTAHLYSNSEDPSNSSNTPPEVKPKTRIVLFGVSGLDEAHAEGDEVNIFMQLDDLPSQVAAAIREGGDGLHEYMVSDSNLRSDAELEARGQAELTLFKDPIVTVTYSSFDRKHTPGGTVEFNLTRPPFVGSLKITEVRVDKVHYDHGHVARYNVTASSVKFTLQDLLRRTILRPY